MEDNHNANSLAPGLGWNNVNPYLTGTSYGLSNPGSIPANYGMGTDLSMGGGNTVPALPNTIVPSTMGTGYTAPNTNPATGGIVTPAFTQDQIRTGNAPSTEQGWFGKNLGNIQDVTNIVGGLAQVWGSIQANKTAKDALNFQKQSYQTNLVNQIKSYNLALEDRMRARGVQNETSQDQVSNQIAANRLTA